MDASTFDLLPIFMCEVAPIRDSTGEIIDMEWVDANKRMNEVIPTPGGDVIGLRIFEYDANYRESEMVRNIKIVLETGEPLTFITNEGRAARETANVMKTHLIPSERGVLCCSHEINDIAQERNEALDRADLLRLTCDTATHAIAIVDEDAKLIYVNEALLKLSGYEEAELIGQNASMLVSKESFARGNELFLEQNPGLSHRGDSTLIAKSGERIRISSALNNAVMPGNGQQVVIAHLQDVREERRKAHELRDALHRAEQATRLKSEFLANMSHEIRTPLNGVLGMAQALAHEDLTASQNEQVDIILDSGRALMVLLNDILDLSKIEAGKLEISPVECDLRHKLSSLFKLHAAIAEEKGIGLKMHIDPAVPSRLSLDPVRVRQCIGNLVSNAIKFTSEGEVMIVVTCTPSATGEAVVTVHVTDTGCGIAEDKIERIFDSFSQEDGSTTRRFGGTGLGLSITRQLARIMGGDVTAVSRAGKGSIFTLSFSAGTVASHQAETTPAAPALRVVEQKPRAGLSGCRVLVVDDNFINRRVARSFLDSYGVDLAEAADGNEALEWLNKDRFDIVLMDIHMPELDGIEALRQLRMSSSPNRFVPVVALTADSMHGDRERFLEMGFDGYVSKPIEERALMTAVGQVLSVSADAA